MTSHCWGARVSGALAECVHTPDVNNFELVSSLHLFNILLHLHSSFQPLLRRQRLQLFRLLFNFFVFRLSSSSPILQLLSSSCHYLHATRWDKSIKLQVSRWMLSPLRRDGGKHYFSRQHHQSRWVCPHHRQTYNPVLGRCEYSNRFEP